MLYHLSPGVYHGNGANHQGIMLGGRRGKPEQEPVPMISANMDGITTIMTTKCCYQAHPGQTPNQNKSA